MRIKLDENIPEALAQLLQTAGHEVLTVAWAVLQEPARKLVNLDILERLDGGLAILDLMHIRIRSA